MCSYSSVVVSTEKGEATSMSFDLLSLTTEFDYTSSTFVVTPKLKIKNFSCYTHLLEVLMSKTPDMTLFLSPCIFQYL